MTSNTTQGAPISDGFALTRLEKRVAELEAALEPFVEFAAAIGPDDKDYMYVGASRDGKCFLTIGMLRRAKEALEAR